MVLRNIGFCFPTQEFEILPDEVVYFFLRGSKISLCRLNLFVPDSHYSLQKAVQNWSRMSISYPVWKNPHFDSSSIYTCCDSTLITLCYLIQSDQNLHDEVMFPLSETEDDIGEDFLSSWKPSTLKNDATLDFGNDTPPKAKRNSFSLDKLDADFDFGGGFAKLSAFSVDMSDLDFPSPPIKTQKFKTKIREKSEGKEEGKDNFKFEFDFKGLDEFDLDSTLLKGKEEKKKPEQEMLPRNSGENRETASKSKNIVLSKPTDDISECSEIGAVPKAQTAMDSNFKLAERNLEWVEPPEGVTSCLAQSTCASGSQDAGNDPKKQKQTTVIKQDVVADACSFGNLLHTGDSNSMKDASIQECPDNVASSPASSFQSGSRDKLSLKSTPSEGKLGSKEPEEGDQCQCLAKIDSSHAEMPNFDSHSKNSIPTENEHSKCNLDTYKTDSILKNAAMSGIKKISSDKLNTMVREDMDDNIRGEINQCQNQEALGKDQNTPSKNPFSTMQRQVRLRYLSYVAFLLC
eukprot:Gb_07197 [translate_table: standard]